MTSTFLSEMTTPELAKYAAETYGVEVNPDLPKQQIINWLQHREGPISSDRPLSQPDTLVTPATDQYKAIQVKPEVIYPLPGRPDVMRRTPYHSFRLPELTSNSSLIEMAEVPPEQFEKSNGQVIDPFDFETYADEFEFFSRYFEQVELYLRAAIYLLYKYEYLTTEEDRARLEEEINSSSEPIKKLRDLTDVFEPRELLSRWYQHFNPEKLAEKFIDEKLENYHPHLYLLFNDLYRRYVDPDYPRKKKLWFAENFEEPGKRAGLIEEVREAVSQAHRTNFRASFQPKTAFLQLPPTPRSRAKIITTPVEKVTGKRGITISKITPVSTPRRLEVSLPGTRIKPTSQKRIQELAAPTTELEIDPEKLIPGRGGYTIDQLKAFLGQLGLKKTGKKSELVDRLKEALGIE